MRFLLFIKLTFIFFFVGAIFLVGLALYGFSHYNNELPDVKTLKQYLPPMVTRIHSSDGELLTELAAYNRFFLDISYMPDHVKQAFIAAEDQRFYSHYGVDVIGLTRAMLDNILRYARGQRLHGASTITQQVAKNMLLYNNDVTLDRKIKEAILAIRLENNFSKDEILELYLNEIYLGQRSYGVVAAAVIYFNKSLDALTLEEAAYLAALPKGPNNYNPVTKKKAAIGRRNWVLKRMLVQQFIDQEQYDVAINAPLNATIYSTRNADVASEYYVNDMLKNITKNASEFTIKLGGFSVRTTLDTTMQRYAVNALQQGLIAYDERHIYRKYIPHIAFKTTDNAWQDRLVKTMASLSHDGMLPSWRYATVIAYNGAMLQAITEHGDIIMLDESTFPWPKVSYDVNDIKGNKALPLTDIFEIGDIMMVDKVNGGRYIIRQIPEVNGAITVLDPYTGRILAMVGGFDYAISKFNRATQAKRQPGSALKPFIYLCALEHNIISPLDVILDAPIVIDQGSDLGLWKPKNYGRGYKFYGPQPLRVGIEKSRNLMTVRLADAMGVYTMKDCLERYNIGKNIPPFLSVSLGAFEVTLLDLTASYASFVNGGRPVTPIYVDRLQDRFGTTLYKSDDGSCIFCDAFMRNDVASIPHISHATVNVVNEDLAYIINDMLQGVVESGTAKSLKSLHYPLAGKTGTTNDSIDSWFMGFSPNLVVGVYVGFDTPRSLGRKPNGANETGSSVALPIFKNFMEQAINHEKPSPFRTPPNIINIRMDTDTWNVADDASTHTLTQPVTPSIWQHYLQTRQPDNGVQEGIY